MARNCLQCLEYGKCFDGLFEPAKAEGCESFIHQTGQQRRKAARKKDFVSRLEDEAIETADQARRRHERA